MKPNRIVLAAASVVVVVIVAKLVVDGSSSAQRERSARAETELRDGWPLPRPDADERRERARGARVLDSSLAQEEGSTGGSDPVPFDLTIAVADADAALDRLLAELEHGVDSEEELRQAIDELRSVDGLLTQLRNELARSGREAEYGRVEARYDEVDEVLTRRLRELTADAAPARPSSEAPARHPEQ